VDSLRVLIIFNEATLPPTDADWSSEAGVAEAVEGVAAALESAGHSVRRLGLKHSAYPLIDQIRSFGPPDVVFNLCEAFAGTSAGEAELAGTLAVLGLSFTGSDAAALALVRNKAKTKWMLQGAGVPTAAFLHLPIGAEPPEEEILELLRCGPLIVKPAEEDASLGIGPDSVVGDLDSLRAKVRQLAARYGDVLIERFLPGREFNVSIVSLPEPVVLPLAEINFPNRSDSPAVVTYDAKWSPESADYSNTPVVCPAQVDEKLSYNLRSAALSAFQLTGCRDYARIDIRLDAKCEPQVLEVNANPDLSPTAGLARSINVSGLGYDRFVCQVAELAARRGRTQASATSRSINKFDAQTREQTPSVTLAIRDLKSEDRPAILALLNRCGVFRPDEIGVADEILQEAQEAGPEGHYKVLVAVLASEVVGWSCHGLVPLTDGTYDLYWIAVDPKTQGHGIGRQLLREIEDRIRLARGRWLVAETSSTAAYEPTRQFYVRCEFHAASEIPDFYRSGDGRVIFTKRVD
jgi:D-alanine-D-alanine ligase